MALYKEGKLNFKTTHNVIQRPGTQLQHQIMDNSVIQGNVLEASVKYQHHA